MRRASFDVLVTSPSTTIEEDLPLVGEVARVRPAVKTILLAPMATPEGVIAALRARVFACFGAPFEVGEIASMTQRAIQETDWRHGIQVLSAHRGWLAVRLECRLMNADRLVSFLNELPSDRPEEERDRLMVAFREILLNAMEHGGHFDPDKVVEVTAVRTQRAIVFHVRDPGPGFPGTTSPTPQSPTRPTLPSPTWTGARSSACAPVGSGSCLPRRSSTS